MSSIKAVIIGDSKLLITENIISKLTSNVFEFTQKSQNHLLGSETTKDFIVSKDKDYEKSVSLTLSVVDSLQTVEKPYLSHQTIGSNADVAFFIFDERQNDSFFYIQKSYENFNEICTNAKCSRIFIGIKENVRETISSRSIKQLVEEHLRQKQKSPFIVEYKSITLNPEDLDLVKQYPAILASFAKFEDVFREAINQRSWRSVHDISEKPILGQEKNAVFLYLYFHQLVQSMSSQINSLITNSCKDDALSKTILKSFEESIFQLDRIHDFMLAAVGTDKETSFSHMIKFLKIKLEEFLNQDFLKIEGAITTSIKNEFKQFVDKVSVSADYIAASTSNTNSISFGSQNYTTFSSKNSSSKQEMPSKTPAISFGNSGGK